MAVFNSATVRDQVIQCRLVSNVRPGDPEGELVAYKARKEDSSILRDFARCKRSQFESVVRFQ